MKLVKIVVTTGPSLEDLDSIREAAKAGADVFRLNFSHGSYDEHVKRIENIRIVEKELDKPLAILADLQGPKIRITSTVAEEGILLQEGAETKLRYGSDPSNQEVLYVDYPYLVEDVEVGSLVYLDDGKIQLRVTSKNDHELTAQVVAGGIVTSHKGISFAGARLRLPALTDKDLKDLDFLCKQDIDFIGLSFVREPEDIMDLRRRLDKARRNDVGIVAKIERHEALEDLNSIVEASDAIMVARGDLALDIPLEDLALVQKEIIRICVEKCKPVIVATQMLDSMIERPFPGRAEITDVANAVMDGSDAVMLSGETAFGKYPILAIETMKRIIEAAETYPFRTPNLLTPKSVREALVESAVRIAERSGAELLVVATETGASARITSAFRSVVPILAVTHNLRLQRQLCLSRAVIPIRTEASASAEEVLKTSVKWSLEHQIASKGDLLLYIFGDLTGVAGSTNSVKIYRIPTVIGNVEILKPSKGYMVGHYLKRLNGIAFFEAGKTETYLFGKDEPEGHLFGNVVWIQEPSDGAVITVDLETGKIYNGHYVL
ncbi:MAG TPA: pyruvate kinase [Fervidobacterium sp.]|nr:pyruvate kinase [Fervidobacterium sp.]